MWSKERLKEFQSNVAVVIYFMLANVSERISQSSQRHIYKTKIFFQIKNSYGIYMHFWFGTIFFSLVCRSEDGTIRFETLATSGWKSFYPTSTSKHQLFIICVIPPKKKNHPQILNIYWVICNRCKNKLPLVRNLFKE